jgi:hypothetical protein
MLQDCTSVFSVEISEEITEIGCYAFFLCHSLRNVAFPPDVFGNCIFLEATDLLQLFDSESEIRRELQHRFDRLPIHKLVYYQSYHQEVLQHLIAAINMRSCQRRTLRVKLDLTGNQQDCLGMTPLHILACSSVHDLELYRVIIENYPTNLITEDRWGALPLLYAFWGAAPAEILHFLLESYQSLYPGYEFNWTIMVRTMGWRDTPKDCIENLLHVKKQYFPEQPIDWEYLLYEFSQPSHVSRFQERMRFFFMCGMSEPVEALAFKVWRDHITSMIQTAEFEYLEDNLSVLHGIQEQITHFEDELLKLKEITTILELALWKLKMNESSHLVEMIHCKKKMRNDESDMRRQCRVTCGADVVIGHVLPFLITAGD